MIVLLGATGYLGRAFAAELRKRKLEFIPLSRRAVDYTRFDVLFGYLSKSKPDLVINAAGFACEAGCEDSRAEALRANTLLPQTLARACYLSKIPWGHVSSGSIYSGGRIGENGAVRIERDLARPEISEMFGSQPERFHGFVESDEPNCSFRSPPCSFYAGTKALAEEALRVFADGYVWRPCELFDEFDHPRNFLSRIRGNHAADAVSSFTHRGDFVRACLDLWERHAPFGVYNLVNPGLATTRQFAAAAECLPGNGGDNSKAPCDGSRILDSSKLLSTGVTLRPLAGALEDSLKNWQQTPQNQEWLG